MACATIAASAVGFVIANLAMALERDDVGAAGPRVYQAALAESVLVEPAQLGLARRQPVAQLGELRSLARRRAHRAPHCRRAAASNASRAGDPALDPREQDFEVEGLQDHVVGAGLIGADRARRLRTCR